MPVTNVLNLWYLVLNIGWSSSLNCYIIARLSGEEAYQGEASKADWDDTTAYGGADNEHIAAFQEEEPELDPSIEFHG